MHPDTMSRYMVVWRTQNVQFCLAVVSVTWHQPCDNLVPAKHTCILTLQTGAWLYGVHRTDVQFCLAVVSVT